MSHLTPPSPPSLHVWTYDVGTAEELRKAFLSWHPQGGLFLPIRLPGLTLGDTGMLMVKLPDGSPRIGVAATVVWMSPANLGRTDRPEGVGVAFEHTPTGQEAKDRIERLLGPTLGSDRSTWTM